MSSLFSKIKHELMMTRGTYIDAVCKGNMMPLKLVLETIDIAKGFDLDLPSKSLKELMVLVKTIRKRFIETRIACNQMKLKHDKNFMVFKMIANLEPRIKIVQQVNDFENVLKKSFQEVVDFNDFVRDLNKITNAIASTLMEFIMNDQSILSRQMIGQLWMKMHNHEEDMRLRYNEYHTTVMKALNQPTRTWEPRTVYKLPDVTE